MAIGFSALAVTWRKRALSEIIQLTDGVQDLLFPVMKFLDISTDARSAIIVSS
jgi:hypothetical protein